MSKQIVLIIFVALVLALITPITYAYCNGEKYTCGIGDEVPKGNNTFLYTIWKSPDEKNLLSSIRIKISPYDNIAYARGIKEKVITIDPDWTVTEISLRTDDPDYKKIQFEKGVDYRVVKDKPDCFIQTSVALPCESLRIIALSPMLQENDRYLDITFGPFTGIKKGGSVLQWEEYVYLDTVPPSEELMTWPTTTYSSGYKSKPPQWFDILRKWLPFLKLN